MTELVKIVVPLDGGPEHETAIAVASQMAARAGAEVELLTVASRGLVDYDETELREIAEEKQQEFGGEISARTLEEAGSIAQQLAGVANEPGHLLCVSSTARRAIVEAVTGSVSHDIVNAAGVPVVLVGPDCHATWRGTILAIAVDGSAPAEAIVGPAIELAAALGLTPRLYQVADEDGNPPSSDLSDTAYVAGLARQVDGMAAGLDYAVLHSGNAGDALVELSDDDDIAVIAMTTHGRQGWHRLTAPSLLLRVVRHAACPVLVQARH